jgi:hypothetical protein
VTAQTSPEFVRPDERPSIEDMFQDFHEGNPRIYVELVTLARRWKAVGHRACGIGMLFEVLRWRKGLLTTDANSPEFRLNNNYRSRYARLIMRREADLEGIFETRSLHRE